MYWEVFIVSRAGCCRLILSELVRPWLYLFFTSQRNQYAPCQVSLALNALSLAITDFMFHKTSTPSLEHFRINQFSGKNWNHFTNERKCLTISWNAALVSMQLITKLSTQNLQNKNVPSHATAKEGITTTPHHSVNQLQLLSWYSNLVWTLKCLLRILESDLKLRCINFNHGLTEEKNNFSFLVCEGGEIGWICPVLCRQKNEFEEIFVLMRKVNNYNICCWFHLFVGSSKYFPFSSQ